MTDVYFENIHSQIIKHLDNAQKSIKICVAWFTDTDIYRSILKSQDRGINVAIIIANHEFNRNSKVDFKEFLQKNGYVGYIGNIDDGVEEKFMHNKFCLIDDSTVITGSYNWTYKARKNDENIIIIKNEPEIIIKFNEKFENIKPKYGFTIKETRICIVAMEQIMKKWDKNAVSAQKQRIFLPDVDSTIDKF